MAPRHSPRRSRDQHQAAVESAAAAASAHPEDKLVWLHGDLDITIHEARRLPNMDMVTEHLRRFFGVCRPPLSAIADAVRCGSGDRPSHRGTPKIITSDPYVTVSLAGAVIARTHVIPNAQDPVYKEHFRIPVAHRVHRVEFHVKDDDVFGAQHIGTATVSAARLAAGEEVSNEWLQVLGANGKPPKPETALLVSLQFTPVDKDAINVNGIAGNPKKTGVPQTYFPLRKGGMVTLYQDAHIKEGDLPSIELDHGNVYVPARCWEDICHAILGAHHLVYVVGWSISTRVRLVRESTLELPPHVHTLGDLLRYKTQEGVRVCMLVWDDKTSHDKLFIKTGGVMATHDEETRKFFKHSSVICVLSPRYASTKLSYFKQQVVGTLYTHHQKCVIVDSQSEGNYRKITSFIGGLDLCDGRYDTPQHRLFSDLESIYKDDFHNPTFATATKGPRQPWHDLHCKIDGPAAYDVLTNFEQRWKKATKWRRFGRRFKKASHWRDDALLKLERISWILSPSATLPPDDHRLWVTKEEDPQSWHVQVFRSIDSGSVKGFPKDIHEAEKLNLACGKNLIVDKSIHTAYVKAIRSAQHFIYIENQYFLGSSYGWPSYKNPGAADNLVPMELALKIASKIRARERFAVYIVIPMWPEGVPSAASVQEILFWQGQTMQMMYEIVAQELKSLNYEDAHPQDYLNFYCLGNREELPHSDSKIDEQSLDKGAAGLAQKHRRFMIYVHAKGMIVDDEYVIIGSANINQRSLSGSRDTEIAMGAYQPHYTFAERKKHPHGQIYGYRTSLWAEHLGELHDIFKDPSSLECVQYVNNRAELNWTKYAAEELTPLKGHLLKYPVKVDADGKVEPLPEHDQFPDVGGKVVGAPTSLPDTLTM